MTIESSMYKNHEIQGPCIHLGKKVDIKAMDSRIELYINGERVKTHEAFGPSVKNKYKTDPEYMPKEGQYQEWTEERIIGWASSIGVHTLLVVRKVFDSVDVKEQGFNPALSIIRLGRKYTDERLETACRIALEHGFRSPRYAHLNSILSSNQDEVYLAELAKAKQEPAQVTTFTRGVEYYRNFGKEESK